MLPLDQYLQLVDLGPALTVTDVLQHVVSTNIKSQRLTGLRVYFLLYVIHITTLISYKCGSFYKNLRQYANLCIS